MVTWTVRGVGMHITQRHVRGRAGATPAEQDTAYQTLRLTGSSVPVVGYLREGQESLSVREKTALPL